MSGSTWRPPSEPSKTQSRPWRETTRRRRATSALVAAVIARRTFLPGAEGPWVEAKRTDLLVVLRRALNCMTDAALALGYPEAATAAASEAVALEPYREHAYLQLIRAQAAAGNRADALHTYERCRRLLADELGVSPSPQTEAAYLAVLGSETESHVRLPHPRQTAPRASTGR